MKTFNMITMNETNLHGKKKEKDKKKVAYHSGTQSNSGLFQGGLFP